MQRTVKEMHWDVTLGVILQPCWWSAASCSSKDQLPGPRPSLWVISSLRLALQITEKASASLKSSPICVRWPPVTGSWWPSRSVAAMGAEAGAVTANRVLCPAPLSLRRCVLWDQATPPMAEVCGTFTLRGWRLWHWSNNDRRKPA